MKSILNTLLITCLISVGSVQAQLQKLTMEDAVLRQRTTLAPKRLPQLQWIPGSATYSFVDIKNGAEVLVQGSVGKTETTEILSLRRLNQILSGSKMDTLPKMPSMKWKDAATVAFSLKKKQYELSTKAMLLVLKDSVTLPESVEAEAKSSKGDIAFVNEFNIYIEKNHQSKKITTDGSGNIVYGKSVHREEFGIDKGLFWSPKGNKLAFYRMDQSMVNDYPIVDFSATPAKENIIKYPMAGGVSHHVTLGVYDLSSGKIVYLNTGLPADQYLTNIAWSPDEKSVFIALLNREQNHMKLNQYDAASGDFVKTLFEEKDDKYTEPLHPMEFVPGNNNQFVWQSRRDGFYHLYLYDVNGKMMKQLTKGEWEVSDFTGFDAKGSKAYFQATGNTGIDRDYYSVTLSTGALTKISSGSGVHACVASDDKKYFIDTYSNVTTPRIIQVVDENGKVMNTLLKAENPLANYSAATTRLFNIKGEGDNLLWCRMLFPANFDSTKKYPVIVYVYGGPHAQMITNSWLGGADMWFHYLTQEGYIVFTLDNRGSGWRGKAFEQAVWRNLGEKEMTDQLSGVNHIRKFPYVDGNRLGVNGWSYGGFMTTSLMTRNPGIFKVGVAGGPVIDWSYYEIMYTERYMGTPDANPGGYKLNNLLNYIGQLNGRLMLIHGTSDDVVVWQHSMMYLKKSVSSGVQVDYMVYPGHLHNVLGKDRVHLNEKITRYFNDYLK